MVNAYRTKQGRRVFVEAGNEDGWLSTDAFVDPASPDEGDTSLVAALRDRLDGDGSGHEGRESDPRTR